MKDVKITKMTETRSFYEFINKNKKGEKIVVEITKCYPEITDGSLPVLWKKHGFTRKLYTSYLSVDVFVTDKDGNCWGKYNPTIKLSDDKKRHVINFNWLLNVSDENIEKILKKIRKMAFQEVTE